MKFNSFVLAAAAALTATAASAAPVAVPEIDAMSGTAALAVVAGAVALIRDRAKR